MTSKYTLPVSIGVCLVAALPVAGCTQPMVPAPSPSGTRTMDTKIVRLDPAAVCCGQIGGTPSTVKNVDGSEYGMCAFPNTTQCEEGAFFRGEGCRMNAVPNSNPAR